MAKNNNTNPFGSKKKAIANMRKTKSGSEMYMITDSGQKASHKMSWVGDPSKKRGNFAVFPTIAPKTGKEMSRSPKDWIEQTPQQAKQRNELINVNSRRKAEKLAAGSWKKGSEKKIAMAEYRANKTKRK